jgi:hypothetical protein
VVKKRTVKNADPVPKGMGSSLKTGLVFAAFSFSFLPGI